MKKFSQTYPQITKAINIFFTLYLHNMFQPWTGSSSGAFYGWTLIVIMLLLLCRRTAIVYALVICTPYVIEVPRYHCIVEVALLIGFLIDSMTVDSLQTLRLTRRRDSNPVWPSAWPGADPTTFEFTATRLDRFSKNNNLFLFSRIGYPLAL
jgi:hypothetical protein